MLSAIKINRFRGIRECEIKGLKNINVFIGRNNHGKSSIIEALYLASAAFEYDHPFAPISKISYLLNRRSKRGLSWHKGKETLWYRYETHEPLKIEVLPQKRGKLEIELFDRHIHPLLNFPKTQSALFHFDKKLRQRLPSHALSHLWALRFCLIDGYSIESDMTVNYTIGREPIFAAFDSAVPHFRETKAFMSRMMFIDENLLREMESVEKTLWNDLLKKRDDKLVTEILRRGYEVEVEDITYVPMEEIYQLAIKLPKTTIRVDDLGDGARYSMILIMVAALARNTAILIEEPENHQHPAGVAKTLEMLFDIIKRNNIQIFITTHSLEFVKLAEIIAKEKRISINIFFIEMDKAGRIQPRTITPEDSENLAKAGLDMRFLDMI